MRLECPNCHVKLNIIDKQADAETSCPSCGTQIPLSTTETTQTVTHREPVVQSLGPFLLIDTIGEGGLGTVWRARDTRLDRFVAIKVPRSGEFDEKTKAKFINEARLAAALEHPNIVRIYEVSAAEGEGPVYIVMQLIVGESLGQRIHREKLTFVESAQLMSTIARALDHAYRKEGIVHRDLKPGNILLETVGEESIPYIADFGLAKQVNDEITVTAKGEVIGTIAYMSPEQARGVNAEHRSDIFSLGVILYELLSGIRPFEGSSRYHTLQNIQHHPPRNLQSLNKEIPRSLETICLKALAKAPEERYQTAKEFADDLDRFVRGEAILAKPESVWKKGARWIQRNKSLATTGLLGLLCLVLATSQLRQQFAPVPPIPVAQAEPNPPEPTSLIVEIETDPSGAQIVVVPRDPLTGEGIGEKAIRPESPSPVMVELLPGHYFIVAKLSENRFHEVQRYVPTRSDEFVDTYRHTVWRKRPNDPRFGEKGKEAIQLPEITIPKPEAAQEMILLSGKKDFHAGIKGDNGALAFHPRPIAPFYLDPHEVTIGEYLAQNKGLFPRNMKPSGDQWTNDFPMTHLLYDLAIEYAESIGKRLPTEFEYEFAATNGGTTKFPWGDDPRVAGPLLAPVGTPDFDQTVSVPGVVGLFSNGAEFTESWGAPYPNAKFAVAAKSMMPAPGVHLAIRGCPIGGGFDLVPSTIPEDVGARMRYLLARTSCVHDRIGFRCAKSKTPRW